MEKRESTVVAPLAGKSNQYIMEELKVSRKTIYTAKKCLEDGEGLAHKSWAGRHKTLPRPRLINIIKSRGAHYPVRSMRGMARDLNVSEKWSRE